MGYKTKIQCIRRKSGASDQYYINFPMVLAQAMGFEAGEIVEWVVEDNGMLRVKRTLASRRKGQRRVE